MVQNKKQLLIKSILCKLQSSLQNNHLLEINVHQSTFLLQYDLEVFPKQNALLYVRFTYHQQCKLKFICRLSQNTSSEQLIESSIRRFNSDESAYCMKLCMVNERCQLEGRLTLGLLNRCDDMIDSKQILQIIQKSLRKYQYFLKESTLIIMNKDKSAQMKKKTKSITFLIKLKEFITERVQKSMDVKQYVVPRGAEEEKAFKKSRLEDQILAKYLRDTSKQLYEDEDNENRTKIMRKIEIKNPPNAQIRDNSILSVNGFGIILKMFVQVKISNGSIHQETNELIGQQAYINYQGYFIEKQPNGRLDSLHSIQNQISIIKHIKQKSCSYVGQYFTNEIKNKSDQQKLYSLFYPYQSCMITKLVSRGSKKLSFLVGVAISLGFLSFYELTHRDIKPQNIMLDMKNNPKLIDFGSAIHKRPMAVKQVTYRQLKTTQKYNKIYEKLPENLQSQITKQKYETHECFDMYAFGRVLQELILGDELDKQIGQYFSELLKWIYDRCVDLNPSLRIHPEELAILLKILHKAYVELVFELKN